MYKIYSGCLARNDILGKFSCACHQRDGATNKILDKHTRSKPHRLNLQVKESCVRKHTLLYLRTTNVNGFCTPIEETDSTNTSQHTLEHTGKK